MAMVELGRVVLGRLKVQECDIQIQYKIVCPTTKPTERVRECVFGTPIEWM
jgi:hypothetical protein